MVLAVAAIVYWPWLGGPGFSMTEGHRAIPGFEMVERWHAGDRDAWWSPTLFGQVYVRKPPGVPWLIAFSSMVFGETEFASRVPSAAAASLMALAALWFGTRWFGRAGGLACGLAQALWPWMWSSGRTAEIEAVHNAFVFFSVLVIIECVVFLTRRTSSDPRATDHGFAWSVSPGWHVARELPWALTLGLATAGAGLAKGPAGWPAIIATIIAGALVCGWRTTTRAWLLIALLIPAAIWGYVYLRMSHAIAATGQTPVTQGPSEFLWHAGKLSPGGIAKVLSMPLVALVSAMPASLALLFPWGGDAKREAAGTPQFQAARILSVACLGSLIALAVLGVDNPRYAMPSVCAVPMVVGYVVWGMQRDFVPLRRRIAQRLMLMRTGREIGWWPMVLVVVATAWCAISGGYSSSELSPRGLSKWSGHALAITAASAGHQRVDVLADHMIEARPEVLWYMSRARGADGVICSARPRWMPGLAAKSMPPELTAGALALLREDDGSDERRQATEHWQNATAGELRELANGWVSKFRYSLMALRASVTTPEPQAGVSGASPARSDSAGNQANDAPR